MAGRDEATRRVRARHAEAVAQATSEVLRLLLEQQRERAALEHADERLVEHLAEADGAACREGVPLRHHREQAVLAPGVRVQPGRHPVPARDDAEVRAPFQQVAQDRQAGVLPELDPDAGPFGGEGREHFGEFMAGDGGGGRVQADAAEPARREGAQIVREPGREVEQRAGVPGERLAGRGRLHAPRTALEQKHAAIRLQVLHAFGRGRGGDAAALGGARDAAEFHRREEDPERHPVRRRRHALPPPLTHEPRQTRCPARVVAA